MNIEDLYKQRCGKDIEFADLWYHMPTLYNYAMGVCHITEIGTRTGNSTTAFLNGLSDGLGGCMVSYDIAPQQFFPPPIKNVVWSFRQQDSQKPDFKISPTELLFIDGDHKYPSVVRDLQQHQNVLKYIIMHDTDPEHDRKHNDGVYRAMCDFLKANTEWGMIYHTNECNGLTVLARK